MNETTTITRSQSSPNSVRADGGQTMTITATVRTHVTCDPVIYPRAKKALEAEFRLLGLDPDKFMLQQVRGGYRAVVEGGVV